MNSQKISDNSGDKKYFIVTPQLVLSKSRSPYDYTLWGVIKMVAGDEGECFLSTRDLADLAMMSTGKITDCRKYLLSCGLLEGEITRDPGQINEVWHLRIPDLWEENIIWRKENDSLKKRIELKREQLRSLSEQRKKDRARSLSEHPPPHQMNNPPHQMKQRRTNWITS